MYSWSHSCPPPPPNDSEESLDLRLDLLHKWIFLLLYINQNKGGIMFVPKIFKYTSGLNMHRLLSAHQQSEIEGIELPESSQKTMISFN